MKAVEHQHRDCAAILLEHGADPNQRGVSGNTALHLAVMVSSKSLVELLLEHGADINAKNKLGYTPLTLAITENCEEMVKFLLQKGADVNAQDNVLRTPLTVATVSGNKKAIQLLLHHGAVLPESDKGFYPCQALAKMVQNDIERIGSSCYETPVIPLETPALAESRNQRGDVPKEEATEKEDSGAAADQNKVSVHTIRVQTYRDYKAEGPEQKEDKCPVWNPEPKSEVLDKAAATVLLPADVCRVFPEPSVAKGSNKGAWQAAGAAKEEDNDSLCNPKHLSDLIDKVISPVQCPAGKCSRVGVRSAAEERGKGCQHQLADGGVCVPQAAMSLRGSCGSQAGFSNHSRLYAVSFPLACRLPWPRAHCRFSGLLHRGSPRMEVFSPPIGCQTDPKGQGKLWASAWLPIANSSKLDARSAAVECGKGILPAASVEAEKEDDDSSWDSEKCLLASSILLQTTKEWECTLLQRSAAKTDSEGEGEVSAAVQLPAANSNRLDARSAAVECSKGVLKRAWREVIKEDGVLQPAVGEAEHEDNDSPWDSELPTLQGEDLQLKVDSSTQTDSEQVKQLKDLKEPFHKNDYYAESGKNALKEKKVITVLRNMQGRLVDSFDSSAAAIPQLQEHIQRLQIQMARLEATIQQQAKTIELFETIQQVSYRRLNVPTVHCKNRSHARGNFHSGLLDCSIGLQAKGTFQNRAPLFLPLDRI
ncbi:hypothetical protein IHE44_0005577 [Lamprotornis superbus]|uniref:Uncharacterized protein n=1 Tax=Lamprotornis superbus TaxID=245042 RepID=A0A835U0N4_9PASS|nr:hypothetical protein IHE44_0005577 [Lamprotornis superbus]